MKFQATQISKAPQLALIIALREENNSRHTLSRKIFVMNGFRIQAVGKKNIESKFKTQSELYFKERNHSAMREVYD